MSNFLRAVEFTMLVVFAICYVIATITSEKTEQRFLALLQAVVMVAAIYYMFN